MVDLEMKEVRERLAEHGLNITLTQASKEWLADQGYDEAFGARPLKRALQRFVESPLSVRLLKGEFKKGDKVLIDVDGEELTFTEEEREPPAEEEVPDPVTAA